MEVRTLAQLAQDAMHEGGLATLPWRPHRDVAAIPVLVAHQLVQRTVGQRRARHVVVRAFVDGAV